MIDADLLKALDQPDILSRLDFDPATGDWTACLDTGNWSQPMPARDAITLALFAHQLVTERQHKPEEAQ